MEDEEMKEVETATNEYLGKIRAFERYSASVRAGLLQEYERRVAVVSDIKPRVFMAPVTEKQLQDCLKSDIKPKWKCPRCVFEGKGPGEAPCDDCMREMYHGDAIESLQRRVKELEARLPEPRD